MLCPYLGKKCPYFGKKCPYLGKKCPYLGNAIFQITVYILHLGR